MKERVFRVALIGAGHIGSIHARVIQESENAELAVVVDTNKELEPRFRNAPFVNSLSSALKLKPDCAIVSVPTRFHEPIALELAEAKIPTLIEKPLSNSSDSAKKIVQAFSRESVPAFVGHVERFNPAVIEMNMRLERGELGRVFQISTRRQSTFPARVTDVGVSTDLGSHDVDLAMFLSKAKYSHVTAYSRNVSDGKFDDLMIASAIMENGVLVNHVVNWMSPFKERSVVVTGEAGVFLADTATGDLTFFKNAEFDIGWEALRAFRGVGEGEAVRFSFPKIEPLKAQLAAYLGSLESGKSSECATLTDGFRAVDAVELLQKSAKKHQ